MQITFFRPSARVVKSPILAKYFLTIVRQGVLLLTHHLPSLLSSRSLNNLTFGARRQHLHLAPSHSQNSRLSLSVTRNFSTTRYISNENSEQRWNYVHVAFIKAEIYSYFFLISACCEAPIAKSEIIFFRSHFFDPGPRHFYFTQMNWFTIYEILEIYKL